MIENQSISCSQYTNTKVTYLYADPLNVQNNNVCQTIYNALPKSKKMACNKIKC